MPNPVVHFEVMVTGDVAAVRGFYEAAFGWTIDTNNPANYGLVDTRAEEGIRGGIGQPMGGPSYATFYVQVEDLDAMLRHVETLGGTTLMAPMPVPGQCLSIAMFKDPAGNPIGLLQRT